MKQDGGEEIRMSERRYVHATIDALFLQDRLLPEGRRSLREKAKLLAQMLMPYLEGHLRDLEERKIWTLGGEFRAFIEFVPKDWIEAGI